MRVVALVLNSVRNDHRVIKEALSLSEHGHEVFVFGVRDNRASTPAEQLAPTCRIVRVPFRARQERFYMFLWLAASLIPALAIVWAMSRPLGQPETWSVNAVVSVATAIPVFLSTYPDRVVVIVCAGFLLAYGLFRAKNAGRRIRNYRAMEGESVSPGLLKFVRDLFHAAVTIVVRGIRLRIIQDAFFAELDRLRPDVVHCHDLPTLPMGVRYKARRHCILVYDSHEIFEEIASTSWLLRAHYRRVQRGCSGEVDAFITVNDSLARFLNDRYPRLPKARVIKNAVEFPPGVPLGDYDGRLHRAAGLDEGQRILLYQGGFSPHRGLEHLVGAAPQLPDGWRILLMGWGKLEERLRRQARTADPTGDRVFFLPPAPHDDLLPWTMGAAIGIIPYENSCLNHTFCTPNKLWEYPAAGLPILVSPLPELEEAVRKNDIGWLLEPVASPETIAGCLSRITEEDMLQKRANCRAFASRDNWGVYERRLADLYAEFSPSHAGVRQAEGHERRDQNAGVEPGGREP